VNKDVKLVHLDILLNNSGIILEIAGFIIILFVIRAVKPKGGSFTSAIDKFGNVL
jgi:hypothetical protein